MQDTKKLFEILADNAASDCGKKWQFANIRTVEGYQNIVPLSRYDDYAPLIELTTRIGETGIFAGLPLVGYAQTSGTTGVPKRIPCTQKHLADYVAAFEKLSVSGSTLLLFESMPHTFKYADQKPLDSITGLVLNAEQKKLKDDSHKRIFRGNAVTSPMELLVTKEVMDSTHLRLLFALIDKNVEQIVAPFTWGVLEMFSYLEANWKDIVNNIRTGKISEHVHVSDDVRAELETKLKKNPKRADELDAIFAEGFSEPVAQKIWPNFRRVVAAGSGSFAIYTDKLPRYIGSAEHINGFYASSEAVMGECLVPGTDVYTLADGNVFFEFLPENSTDEKPLLADQLETRKNYEVIVTNNAGFYRYHTGDIIRWEGNNSFTPIYRRELVSTLEGVQIDEPSLLRAVRSLSKELGIDVEDYCICANAGDKRLVVMLEPSAKKASMAKLYAIGEAELSAAFDKKIAQENPAYAAARNAGQLESAVALVLEAQTQLLFRDVRKYRAKIAPDQIKPIRVLDNPVQEKFFFFALDKEYHSVETVKKYVAPYSRKKN